MSVQIARVRTRTASREPRLAGQRIERLLRASDLSPPDMPPAAILIVRHIADPSPGTLPVDHAEALPPAAWERAARDRLADLYRGASRPVVGPVPAGAEAVLFRDRAELLACLARDLLQHTASGRWWWQSLQLPSGLDPASVITAQMIERARFVPATLDLLDRLGDLARVTASLSRDNAIAILSAVCEDCGVPIELTAPFSPGNASSAQARRMDTLQARLSAYPHMARAIEESALSPAQQALVGVSLTLYRTPAAARSETFVRTFSQWWIDSAITAGASPPEVEPASSPNSPLPHSTGDDFNGDHFVARPDELRRGQLAAGPESTVDSTGAIARPTEGGGESSEQTRTVLDDPAAAVAFPEPATSPFESDAIETSIGGAFYLINLIDTMGLLSYFEEDWRLGEQLGPWGVLDVLAHGLLCDASSLESDRLWEALAMLRGAEMGEPPGRDFRGVSTFVAPVAWRQATPDGHLDQLPTMRLEGLLIEQMSRDLRSWLRSVLPYVILRVGADAEDAPHEAVAHLLLAPAQLYLTSTHVDVVMPLDAISITARRAGLDQDPGWLPDFGRVIQFHFQ